MKREIVTITFIAQSILKNQYYLTNINISNEH